MSAKKPNRRRIEIDVSFAPVPQALILDHQVSAQACRLWGVLFVFRWNDLQPDFDKLAEALTSTARSVYRWLQELEATGWIAWDRNADIPDRFTLRTTPVTPGSDTDVNSNPKELIVGSKELTPRSKILTPVSQELTQVSISTLLDRAPIAQIDTVSSDQKIQKIQNPSPPTQPERSHGGDDDENRSRARVALRACGLYNGSIRQILALGIDTPTLVASAEYLRNEGWGPGAIADELRDNPPAPGVPYARAVAAPLQATRPNLPETTVAPAELLRQMTERRR